MKVLVEGQKRARVKRFVETRDYFLVEVEEVAETADKLAPAPEATNSVESVSPEPQQAAVTDENDAPPPAPALQQESAAQNRAVQHDSPPQEGSPRRRSHGGALPT